MNSFTLKNEAGAEVGQAERAGRPKQNDKGNLGSGIDLTEILTIKSYKFENRRK